MKEQVVNQYEAALSTLNYCIINCPDNEWNSTHGDAPFSQVVFHALFYSDFYLEDSEVNFRNQTFHKDNKIIFKDYEELEDQIPRHVYTKEQCSRYLKYCVKKAKAVIMKINDTELFSMVSTNRKIESRLELYIYTIRHIQHHAAQLGFRIQLITQKEMPWFSSGWKA